MEVLETFVEEFNIDVIKYEVKNNHYDVCNSKYIVAKTFKQEKGIIDMIHRSNKMNTRVFMLSQVLRIKRDGLYQGQI